MKPIDIGRSLYTVNCRRTIISLLLLQSFSLANTPPQGVVTVIKYAQTRRIKPLKSLLTDALLIMISGTCSGSGSTLCYVWVTSSESVCMLHNISYTFHDPRCACSDFTPASMARFHSDTRSTKSVARLLKPETRWTILMKTLVHPYYFPSLVPLHYFPLLPPPFTGALTEPLTGPLYWSPLYCPPPCWFPLLLPPQLIFPLLVPR